MKFINCSEALPGRVKERYQVSEYSYIRNVSTKGQVDPGNFRSYAGLNDNWALDKFEWLDETPMQLFTVSDLILVWAKAQEVTYDNTSYDKLEEANELDYSHVEKERNEFFKYQFNVDIP